jgi:SAM-dependent methyltransferase
MKKPLEYPDKALKFAIWKIKDGLLWNYHYNALREPKIKYIIPVDGIKNEMFSLQVQEEIAKELKMDGLNIVDFKINISDYRNYIKKAEYEKSPNYYGGGKGWNFTEKSLEHYLAAKLLDLSKDDVYIDIANSDSPAPDIYNKLYGCEVYRQDLVFPEGVHGNIIGGDAGKMPVENGFATKMGLHCSFEHFEQDSDIRFIKEASRVLKKRGKLCIVPLYLFKEYSIMTDPSFLPKGGIQFENDAVLYCWKGFRNRHGRFYDISHFYQRIRNNLNNLKLTIYMIQNEKEVDTSCYVKFIALFEKE